MLLRVRVSPRSQCLYGRSILRANVRVLGGGYRRVVHVRVYRALCQCTIAVGSMLQMPGGPLSTWVLPFEPAGEGIVESCACVSSGVSC